MEEAAKDRQRRAHAQAQRYVAYLAYTRISEEPLYVRLAEGHDPSESHREH